MPAYVIFHDATLREIAARCPATLAELGTVSGVGESQAGQVRPAGAGHAGRPPPGAGGAGPARMTAYQPEQWHDMFVAVAAAAAAGYARLPGCRSAASR